jgi:hypothetical protein
MAQPSAKQTKNKALYRIELLAAGRRRAMAKIGIPARK